MRGLRARADEALLALAFLTRLPVGHLPDPTPPIGASIWAWPLVGCVVGGLGALVWLGATALGLGPLTSAGLAVGATVLATGALHEDALADVADGFGGGSDAARRLEIMRDSRVGSFGVLALLLALILRIGAVSELPGPVAVAGFIALAALSRAGMAAVLAFLPPARRDGLGHAAAEAGRAGGRLTRQFLAALVLGVAPAAVLVGVLPAAFVTLAMAAAVLLLAFIAQRLVGGQTGDVCGASQQLAEIAGWLVLAALF